MTKLSKEKQTKYFNLLKEAECSFLANISYIEHIMESETKIKGIEFVWVDGQIVGIGSEDRKMKLIHRS